MDRAATKNMSSLPIQICTSKASLLYPNLTERKYLNKDDIYGPPFILTVPLSTITPWRPSLL